MEKKTSTKRTNNSSKTKSSKQTRSSARSEKSKEKSSGQSNQMRALYLFVASIFLLFVIFIKGENVWYWIHSFVLGLFGYWAIAWPILMSYVAIMTTLEKKDEKIAGKIGLIVAIIFTVCATAFFYNGIVLEPDTDIFTFMGTMYSAGIEGIGSGFIGAILAGPLSSLLGAVGAQIVLYLILFLSVMTLTNTTLAKLFKGVAKSAKYASNEISNIKEKREEKRDEKREVAVNNRKIDIAMDDDVKKQKMIEYHTQSPKSNEKLDKLNKVFGIEQDEEQASEVQQQEKAETSANDHGLHESIMKFAQKHSTEKKEEVTVNEIRTNPVFEPHSSVVTPVNTPKTSLENATKAAEEFIKKKEENEKNELATSAQMALYEESKNKPYTYCFPPIHLLKPSVKLQASVETEELQSNGQKLVDTLNSFSVQTKIVDICRGPSVTRYEIQPAAGVRINKITNLADDLALNLAAVGVRIEAPIPGKAAVGIEIPNKNKTIVRMRELLESNQFITAKSNLTVILGKDITGLTQVADLAKMPHTLIAGTTGSGKSVCINSLIISLIYKSSPDDVRFLMIDPKVVELGIYNGIPHLLVPVVTDPRKAAGALAWAVTEMLNRYKLFASFNVKDLAGYNALAKLNNYKDENEQPMLKMPQIVIIIDELADLMMAAPNEVEDSICRLAQMARAAGMHLVVATQRPTVDVVTGLIKANIPSRVAFAVSSAIDSKTILDGAGAEKLLGQGDMLFSPVGSQKPQRIQGCFVTESEIEAVVDFIKTARVIEYDQQIIDDIEKNAIVDTSKQDKDEDSGFSDDPMMEEAIKCVMEAGQASTSLLQRRLRLGHARAGRLIDQMADMGVVGPYEGSKPRQLLMTYPQWLERNMQRQDEPKDTTAD